jgi:hypothetical protein
MMEQSEEPILNEIVLFVPADYSSRHVSRSRVDSGLCWPPKFGRVERLQAVDALWRFGFPIPFEELQHDPVWQEIRHGETMLLNRLDLLLHVQMGGRR